jgi:hypothetical protein
MKGIALSFPIDLASPSPKGGCGGEDGGGHGVDGSSSKMNTTV